MEKILFLNTYENYHTNGSNRSYWSKYFRSLSKEIGEENKMKLYSSFNEDMPIYEYYSELRERFVRIMQYNPKNEIVKSRRYPTSRFYTAWLDERVLCVKENESVFKPELVVCLLMTSGNINQVKRLIRTWLSKDGAEKAIQEIIDGVYIEQNRIDAEGVNGSSTW